MMMSASSIRFGLHRLHQVGLLGCRRFHLCRLLSLLRRGGGLVRLLLPLGRVLRGLGGRLGLALLDDGVGLEHGLRLEGHRVAHVLGGEVGVGVVHRERELASRLGVEVARSPVDLLVSGDEGGLLVLVTLPLDLESDVKLFELHDPHKLAPVAVVALDGVDVRVARSDVLGRQVLLARLRYLDACYCGEHLFVLPTELYVQDLGINMLKKLLLVARREYLYLLARVRVDEVLDERVQGREDPRRVHAEHVLHYLRVVLLVALRHDFEEGHEMPGLEAGSLHINDASNLVHRLA
mmetsp:Transcript_11924/g.23933  ORF Transcript_11924/g.23933 Transcript_11924/m.23933 type:complete len:294 (+) Transcript_11924:156-1037(+)